MRAPLAILALALACGAPDVAQAQPPTLEGWSGCVWSKAPVTAQNWIAALDGKLVASRPSSNPHATPKEALALRLEAACLEQLPVDMRGSIFSSTHARMAKALQRSRPEAIGSKDLPMKVLVCEMSVENHLIMTILNPKKRPKNKDGMKAVCFSAESDGSLTDA